MEPRNAQTAESIGEFRPIFLRDLKVGDYWLVQHPVRFIRVVREETVDAVKMDQLGGVTLGAVPAVRVRATLPTFEIPGHISAKRARQNEGLKAAIVEACRFEEGQDDEWDEIWSERRVHPVRRGQSGLYVDDGQRPGTPPTQLQLYCHHREGVIGRRTDHHFIARGQIEGVQVPAELVPKGVFREAAAFVAEDVSDGRTAPPAASAPGAEDFLEAKANAERSAAIAELVRGYPKTYMELKWLARSRGVDISDIRGPGSARRIAQRLAEAELGAS